MKQKLLLFACLSSSICFSQSFVIDEKLIPEFRYLSDGMGVSVDVSGNYAVVGSAGYDFDENQLNYISNAGAVVVYEKENGVWVEKQILVDPELRSSDAYFGFRVSISGDHIIVGAYRDAYDASGSNQISNSGSASFFKRDAGGNWNFVNTVVSDNRHIDAFFGRSVAVNGNYAIVGAPFENIGANTGAGAAYIYKYNGSMWGLLDKITAGDIHTDDSFGISVDISETDAVVGAEANGYSSTGTNFKNAAGAAYVFNKASETNWVQSSKLTASDRALLDNFGFQVSLYDSLVLVSSHYDDHDENGANTISESGSCYTFKKNASGLWSQQQKIVAPTRYADDSFGLGLSMYDSTIVISTRFNGYDENEANYFVRSGSAYVYKMIGSGSWVFSQKITAPTRNEYDDFGLNVSINENSIIVGAPGQDFDNQEQNLISGAGAAYVYIECTASVSSITISSCSPYVAPDGQTYTSSGLYTAIINNVGGCDSTITINLTINTNTNGTDVVSACDTYTWLDNNTYTSSTTTPMYTIVNGSANGCDSIVTLNLTINTVDNSVISSNDSITANAVGANYQWLDCDNGNAIISGETNQLFVVPSNGNYAVEVTQNGCIDTSTCINVSTVGLKETKHNNISVYPNPTKDIITIESGTNDKKLTYTIFTIEGRIIYESYMSESRVTINLHDLNMGIYLLKVTQDDKVSNYKIVRE